jgi:mRNA interferase RelE/StbE
VSGAKLPYTVVVTPKAQRQLAQLKAGVAEAVIEFIFGPVADNPQRVGGRLHSPLGHLHSARRGGYRVLYEIDQEQHLIRINTATHRNDAYRPGG